MHSYFFTYNPVCNCIDFAQKIWKHDFHHFILKKRNRFKAIFQPLKSINTMITIVKFLVMLVIHLITVIFV